MTKFLIPGLFASPAWTRGSAEHSLTKDFTTALVGRDSVEPEEF
ncbi:MAG TPA: hypothetical protein VJR28_06290 [Chthoniobacterales bacterium]|nr:hypothetical protein [Chthoniobacterales bacterium]